MNGRYFIRRRVIPALAPGFLAIVAVSLIDPGSWLHAATYPAAISGADLGAAPGINRETLERFLTLGIFLLVCFGLLFFILPRSKRRSGRCLRSPRWDRSGPPFKPCPLLNKGEGRLLTLLDRVVPDIFGQVARVCPQVSYGEFLACSKFRKSARMNCRRADFVVISADHRVALVVELQGSGHFGSSSKSAWKARKADRTKRSALIEAGIPLLEVNRTASEASVTTQIQGLINPRQGGYRA